MNNFKQHIRSLVFVVFVMTLVVGTGVVFAQEIEPEENFGEEYFIEDESGEITPITKEEYEEFLKETDGEEIIEEYTEELKDETVGEKPDGADEAGDANLACFDHYPFGQLNISGSLDKGVYNPNGQAILNLKITNTNPNTSISNGKIIFQIRKHLKESNTTVLLSEKVIASGLSYPRQTTKEDSFSFDMPASLPSGSYHGYIFITDNDFPISGLVFTQDIAGKVVGFQIENPREGDFNIPYIQENKASFISAKLKNISISPFELLQIIPPDEFPGTINVPVYNPSETKEANVNINSNLYFWDETGKLIGSKDYELNISSNNSEEVSFPVPKNLEAGTYMLRTTLSSGNSQVISKIRFSIPGFAPAVYYQGLTKNEKGQDEFFVCLGNGTFLPPTLNEEGMELAEEQNFSSEGKTDLVLWDSGKNKEIDSLEFNGSLFDPWAGAPQLYSKAVSKNLPKNVSLKTMIYDKEGNLMEENETFYENPEKTSKPFIYYSALIVLLIIVLAFFYKKIRKTNTPINNISILIALLVISSFAYLSYFDSARLPAEEVKAKSSINDVYFLHTAYRCFGCRLPYTAHQYFYMSQSIDFTFPAGDSIAPGSSFDIGKTNYGAWTYISSGFRTPLFDFSDTNISSSANAPMSSIWGASWFSQSMPVSFDFPYTDTWTTSDGRVSCENINANNARCGVSSSFPGGDVSITQKRDIIVRESNVIVPGSHGSVPLSTKQLMVEPTKTITTYYLRTVCVRSGRGGRSCSTSPMAKTIIMPADEDYMITTYSLICIRHGGRGGSRTCGWRGNSVLSPGYGPPPTITLTQTKTINIAPAVTYSCIGSVPQNSGLCSGDSTGLISDTARNVVSSCSAPTGSEPKCEYTCDNGYVKDGNECVVPNSAPFASLSCDPSDCVGFAGVPQGISGYLEAQYFATDAEDSADSLTCNFEAINSNDISVINQTTDCNANSVLISGLSKGDYTAKITATDTEGLSDIKTTSFTLEQDIIADFQCSLDGDIFKNCSKLGEVTTKDTIYFNPDTSTPSEGAEIVSWSWDFDNDGTEDSSSKYPNTKLTKSGGNIINLIVTDNNQAQGKRSNEIQKTINISLPLPTFKETVPY